MNFRTALAAILLLLVFQGALLARQDVRLLVPGDKVEKQLRRGGTDQYQIKLKARDFLHLEIDQRGIDVVLSLTGPDGSQLLEMNNRHLDYGQEPLSFTAQMDGIHDLKITTSQATPGSGQYTIRVVEIRAPNTNDQIRIDAERAGAEGQRIFFLNDVKRLPDALKNYELALSKWRELGDRYWEATTLTNIANVHYALGDNKKALETLEAALPLVRQVNDTDGEWRTLNNIGVVYDALGEKLKAFDYYSQALTPVRAVGDRRNEARTLFNVGVIQTYFSEYQKAINLFQQSQSLYRAIEDPSNEVSSLNRICLTQNLLGDNQKSLDCYNQVLVIFRQLKDAGSVGLTLSHIGDVYTDLGDNESALRYDNEALAQARNLKDKSFEARTLQQIGTIYRRLGEIQKAIDQYQLSAQLAHDIKDSVAEYFALRSLAMIYSFDLKSKQKALEYYNKLLEMKRNQADRTGEATILAAMGGVYRLFGDNEQALGFHKQALPLMQGPNANVDSVTDLMLEIGSDYLAAGDENKALLFFEQALQLNRAHGSRRFVAITLARVARVQDDLGQKQKALEAYGEALSLYQAIDDKAGQAGMLRFMGGIQSELNEPGKAILMYQQALVLERQVGDRSGEALSLISLMNFESRMNNRALAIFYGKQAINIYQNTRAIIQGLEKEVQQGYLVSVEVWYRRLADLLIAEGRLPEAQSVLGLLKQQEYLDFVRRDGNEASSLKASELTPEELLLEKRYAEIAGRVTAIGAEYGQLRDKTTRSPDEEQRMAKLEGDLTVANQSFQKFLDEIEKSLTSNSRSDKMFQLRESQGLMDTLKELGSGAVALYTVVGEDKYRVILVTPEVQKAYEYSINAVDLNRKVLAFREALQNPLIDPRPAGQELFKVLIGSELAQDLVQAKAQTLMWSLDGVLRYVPIAALYDGQKYLVETYRNVVFTPASQSRLKDPVSSNWKALGLGVSKAQPGFNPLPSVPKELQGIVRDENNANADGVMPGRVMLDEAFTASAMQSALRQRFTLVHIASHFQFNPGNETDSFLLLGDGSHLTLAQIKSLPNIFSGVDLLTLSACDTATGGSNAGNGKEVEGFGVLAQRQGAKAVLATLWPVADESTQMLMREFYRLHEANPQGTKAEALRQAQIALLRGNGREATDETNTRRSSTQIGPANQAQTGVPFKSDPRAKYSHPYYWAPFILIGNWK